MILVLLHESKSLDVYSVPRLYDLKFPLHSAALRDFLSGCCAGRRHHSSVDLLGPQQWFWIYVLLSFNIWSCCIMSHHFRCFATKAHARQGYLDFWFKMTDSALVGRLFYSSLRVLHCRARRLKIVNKRDNHVWAGLMIVWTRSSSLAR